MRTDNTPPILTSSPDPNRTPATLMSIFSPSGLDSLIKLPGASARISPTVRLHCPSSGWSGRGSLP